MSRKATGLLLLVALISLVLAVGVSYAVSPSEQAKIVAGEQFPKYLNEVIQPNYQHFGFPEKGQYKIASLGEPLENYTIDFKDFDSSKSINDKIRPINLFTFPVLVDGKATIDITVGVNHDGVMEVIDVGGNLNRVTQDLSINKGLSSNRILHFAGSTFVLAKMGSKDVGYSPYTSDPDTGLKSQIIVSDTELLKILDHKNREFQEDLKSGSEKRMGGPTIEYSTELRQESLSRRLMRFIDYVF